MDNIRITSTNPAADKIIPCKPPRMNKRSFSGCQRVHRRGISVGPLIRQNSLAKLPRPFQELPKLSKNSSLINILPVTKQKLLAKLPFPPHEPKGIKKQVIFQGNMTFGRRMFEIRKTSVELLGPKQAKIDDATPRFGGRLSLSYLKT